MYEFYNDCDLLHIGINDNNSCIYACCYNDLDFDHICLDWNELLLDQPTCERGVKAIISHWFIIIFYVKYMNLKQLSLII